MRGSSLAAADVGHSRARLQLLFDTAQGGNPGVYQIRGIAGTKELFASVKDAIHVFMPTHARAGAKRFRDPRDRRKRAQSQFKCAGQICGAVFRCQRESLFLSQAELLVLVIVGDVASCSLRSKPLAQIALVGLRFGGKLRGSSSGPRPELCKAPAFLR